jgi:hypothetical protein
LAAEVVYALLVLKNRSVAVTVYLRAVIDIYEHDPTTVPVGDVSVRGHADRISIPTMPIPAMSSIIERPCWVLFIAAQSEGVRRRSARPPDQWSSRADQRCRNVTQVTLVNSLNDAGTAEPNV